MDKELFSLCKSVFEKTGWNNTGKVYTHDWKGDVDSFAVDSGILKQSPVICPLYTSDYLLEKLPDHVNLRKNIEPTKRLKQNGKGHYTASIHTVVVKGAHAGTPLKAMLQLTIALHDAGQLEEQKGAK